MNGDIFCRGCGKLLNGRYAWEFLHPICTIKLTGAVQRGYGATYECDTCYRKDHPK